MMEAIITNTLTGVKIKVHASTKHPASSYGKPVWVDDYNNAYSQVGMPSVLFDIEITSAEE